MVPLLTIEPPVNEAPSPSTADNAVAADAVGKIEIAAAGQQKEPELKKASGWCRVRRWCRRGKLNQRLADGNKAAVELIVPLLFRFELVMFHQPAWARVDGAVVGLSGGAV